MHDLDQLFGGDHARIIALRVRIEHVLANVVLDHLGDEPVERAPARGCLLQDAGALVIRFHGALDSVDLAAQALQAVQQFRFATWLIVRTFRYPAGQAGVNMRSMAVKCFLA